MVGLLDGLSQFGLGGLEGMDLYEMPAKEKKQQAAEAPVVHVVKEQDFIFDKAYTCPICDHEFKAKTVKVGKAKLVGQDLDLRPKYEAIDMLKYDTILCPRCGYTALSRYFKFVTAPQAQKIKQVISRSFKNTSKNEETYSYEEALDRYRMALANAIVKQAKASEKAYICLKTAWLLRGQGESLDQGDPEYKDKKAKIDADENEFLKNALEGFLAARKTEGYPMCGMDESTVDYLIAVIALRFDDFDVATKLISGILVSGSANARMKEKARNLKEMVMVKIKEKQKA
ncbi:MAG: DUF2225 domain-containing protein [Lachnospiraceae bacterium]|nr:DUF2225 domain-containing protein [Candidatus Merdinaster equi]